MLFLKLMLLLFGFAILASAAGLLLYDVCLAFELDRVEYTVAQKLSDKVQIILVPNDGKFFFTNDVQRSAMGQRDDPPLKTPSGH